MQGRPDLPDDSLVIFTDLDEIPNAETMMAMKHCQLVDASQTRWAIEQRTVAFNLRSFGKPNKACYPSFPWRQGMLYTLGNAQDRLKQNQEIAFRGERTLPTLRGAAMHLAHFGSARTLTIKGLQHGEGGGLYLPKHFEPCAATQKNVTELLATFRDNPLSIVQETLTFFTFSLLFFFFFWGGGGGWALVYRVPKVLPVLLFLFLGLGA